MSQQLYLAMRIKAFISLFFLGLFTGLVNAQVTASFTIDEAEGCAPHIVSFTSTSTGSVTSWEWDLGNSNSSSNENPQATYSNPGTYTVTLTVSDGSSTDQVSQTITVFANPVAEFESPQKGCVPFNVQFTDLSTEGDATITNWEWDFLGGFVDNRQNPDFTYSREDQFTVSLKVTDENGCVSTMVKEDYIEVADPPAAIFTISPTVACEIPVDLTFNNMSSGPGNITYAWDFGDETSSTEKTPAKTIDAFGNYVIKLTVNSDYGCETTTEKLFQAQDIVAEGTLSQNGETLSANDQICPGTIEYSASLPDGMSAMWDFGDGGFAHGTEPGTHYYSTPGEYTVLMTAAPGEECADTKSWTITVEDVRADFNFTPATSCMSPATVNFSNTSTNASTFLWEFPDGSKSTVENPTKEFYVPEDDNQYNISTGTEFNTKLTVTSASGCQSNVNKSFIIKKPTARFTVDTIKGCKPLTVNFTDYSFSEQEITNWEWLFGDGNTLDGANSEVEHTYTNEGEYDARVVITNAEGCTDTSYAITIQVGTTVNPDFEIAPLSFCQNEAIAFSYPKTVTPDIDYWHYKIGNTDVPLNPAGNDTTWFAKINETGVLDVTLTVSSNGCISEITKPGYVTSNGPVADFQEEVICSSPYEYRLQGLPVNHTGFKWVFGDGNSTTTLDTTYTYSSESDYVVEFIAFNGSCSDTARKVIEVREPNATILADTALCAGDSILFDGSASYGAVNYCQERYLWLFNDNTQPVRTNKDTVYHVFNAPGTYQATLITTYDNACKDTITHEVVVYQPKTGFETDFEEGCAPITISFNDTSKAYVHPLQSWHVDYGDGQELNATSSPGFFEHTFFDVGTYSVSMTVTDTFGCSAMVTKEIKTANPSAKFSALTATELCADEPVMFTHNYRGSDSVFWSFGDGLYSEDTSSVITHTYSDHGQYEVSLVVYKYGCADTFSTAADFVKIQKADAYFTLSDTFVNCYPSLIEIKHAGTADSIISGGQWDFGYKNSFSEYAAERQFTYAVPGTYTISLDIETTYGCKDNYSRDMVVTGPRGSFTMDREAICRGEEVTLALKDTIEVFEYEWDLGDGNFVTGSPITHRYYELGDNIPKLILYGDSGRCIPPPVEDTLYVHELSADFAIENPALCEQTNIIFTNHSSGQTSNAWSFSNGNSSVMENFSASFAPGDYQASLIVGNDFGCADTASREFKIHPLPQLWVMPDTAICAGEQAVLRATGGDTIRWAPGSNIANPKAYVTTATPGFTSSYLAVVADTTTGCISQDDLLVTVYQEPDVAVSPEDTSIIIGETVVFRADSLPGVSYRWTPEEFFTCPACATVALTPTASTTVTLNVSDANDCFVIPINIPLEIREEYSLDVPNTFTPNGDGINDVVYIRGWGIQRLVEFRIYNRWGNEVFFTDNLHEGWDGTYNGKLQNIDTYVYVVKVETWEGNVIEKKGTITLLK